MSATLQQKYDDLKRSLREIGGIAVAFSGGVDSTFLAAVAAQELGDRALAVTAHSPLYPEHEQQEAASLAGQIGIRHETVVSDELDVPGFASNPPNRCYLCKSELFTVVRSVADRHGLAAVADGTNADDTSDYRPGRRAAAECGVLSPLLEAGLGKDDIRALSRELGLPTAEKAAFACLASRFPYGTHITEEKLIAVGALETELRALGFHQFRVRHHGEIARIEVGPDELEGVCSGTARERIVAAAKQAGFRYIALDLEGYRTGSMNETLTQAQKEAAYCSGKGDVTVKLSSGDQQEAVTVRSESRETFASIGA